LLIITGGQRLVRYHAVIEVLSEAKATDVAGRYEISRQSVHTWVRRYQHGGLGALADRSCGRIRCGRRPGRGSDLEVRRSHPRRDNARRCALWEGIGKDQPQSAGVSRTPPDMARGPATGIAAGHGPSWLLTRCAPCRIRT
jgi:transposase-like protein